jgi:hypothetical protein
MAHGRAGWRTHTLSSPGGLHEEGVGGTRWALRSHDRLRLAHEATHTPHTTYSRQREMGSTAPGCEGTWRAGVGRRGLRVAFKGAQR